MEQPELLNKLSQIEEHAQVRALFPVLAKERLRMIAALARFSKTEIDEPPRRQQERLASGKPAPFRQRIIPASACRLQPAGLQCWISKRGCCNVWSKTAEALEATRSHFAVSEHGCGASRRHCKGGE